MSPLIQWLRLTLHATGQNDTGSPVMHLELVSPFLDQDLANHRLPFRQVLRSLQPQTPGLERAIAQFATAINSQVAGAQTAWLVCELERDQPTTPATKFDMLFASLLNYLDVATEQEIPDFWFRFAVAKKRNKSLEQCGTLSKIMQEAQHNPLDPLLPSLPRSCSLTCLR